ncbi:MAG: ribonucleoside-diphosphate reductase class [Armatimonadetes bacterium]|nr:ribonucleoside-diphosphate reductase class [Armatimonadota bacterium]
MSVTEDRLSAAGSDGEGDPRSTRTPRRATRRGRAGYSGGLQFPRVNTTAGVHPYDEVEWEPRTATISGEGGEKVFEQRDVEIPAFWSQQATKVVVSKYFRGHLDDPSRERSAKQLISRVADTIAGWGRQGGYFASEEDADTFHAELTYLLLHQHMAFNSPVWFNVGLPDNPKPQCSACFINSVEDNMESIMRLAATEARLFKGGSGAGSNLSRIRSSKERLSGGGIASGPVSFMRGYDAFAGVIKSGGKTRRAAKMVILDIDHPDVVEFINCKADEEKKAWALIESGYNGGFNVPGGAYDSVFFQNANHSVRGTDEFMQAVERGGTFWTRRVTDGEKVEELNGREMLRQIADATWVCGDPGMQFDTIINRWHTCKNTDRIYASNPCSEYMFLNDTACNLASINLLNYLRPDGSFEVERYIHACEVTITAQEIIVDNASYPTELIGENSHEYRPLGLGYANLGALLMALGLPYDSDSGRALAGVLTAIMTGSAYRQSAKIASHLGPFPGYHKNREPMLDVIAMHRDAVEEVNRDLVPEAVIEAARQVWDDALELGERYGYKNSQATVLAPTGTIAFMMDCDTTGIEPDIALVKYKTLVGGGFLKIVNQTVPAALRKLGYTEGAITEIVQYIAEMGTIEGAPGLKDEHLPVFDCAFRPQNGTRSIHHMGHVKTTSMGSKKAVPAAAEASAPAPAALVQTQVVAKPYRRRLPAERHSVTHKFSVGGHEGYIHVGLYEDGTPGEIFVTMSKEGSTISGMMDAFATSVSLALQYGVPLEVMVRKYAHMRFEPAGWTPNPDIPFAKSIMDYIFRWMGNRFMPRDDQEHEAGHASSPVLSAPVSAVAAVVSPSNGHSNGHNGHSTHTSPMTEGMNAIAKMQEDAPPCSECGNIMVRAGACYRCDNCVATSGCG